MARYIDTFAARNLKMPGRKLPTESKEYYAMQDDDELDKSVVSILDEIGKKKNSGETTKY